MSENRIIISSYNNSWPEYYETEKEFLINLLKDDLVAIHHVGSTSVPGLCAKPKIDIIMVVKDLKTSTLLLNHSLFEYKGEVNIPLHLFYVKKKDDHNINLHVYEEGNSEINLNIMFRDILRSSDMLRDEYAKLKNKLISDPNNHQKTSAGFTGYNLGKNDFISQVLKQAGFNEICIRHCSHHNEWIMYNEIYSDYKNLYYDYQNNKDHEFFNMVIYLGVEIIGIIHGFHHKKETKIINIIFRDKYKAEDYIVYTNNFINRWTNYHDKEVVLI